MQKSNGALQSYLTELERRREKISARRVFLWKKVIPYGLTVLVLAAVWCMYHPINDRNDIRLKVLRGGMSLVGVDPEKFSMTKSSKSMPDEILRIRKPERWNS